MTLKSLQQYGKGFQLKVLGSLLTDKKFLLNVRDVFSTSQTAVAIGINGAFDISFYYLI